MEGQLRGSLAATIAAPRYAAAEPLGSALARWDNEGGAGPGGRAALGRHGHLASAQHATPVAGDTRPN